MRKINIKRVYEQSSKQDGARVLIDRVWPRGFSKSSIEIDFWFKDIAPTVELRKWFDHDPVRWEEFRSRYIQELNMNSSLTEELMGFGDNDTLTLLYAAKDEIHNHARVLCEYLNENFPGKEG